MRLALVLALALTAEPAWKKLDTVDGIGVFSRELPEERCVELRLTSLIHAPVDVLCDAAFGLPTLDPSEPNVILRRLISDTPDGGRVTYEQIESPIGSNRDYAVRAFKVRADGKCKTTFVAANEFAPPLPDGYVRIQKLYGGWEFEPAGDGSTRATYKIFTDPGGSVPAIFVEGTRRRAAIKWFQLVLERAAPKAAQK
jgi:hypothetical protein